MELYKYKMEMENMNCSICLDDIDDNFAELNCSHIFHKKCIGNWIKQNSQKTCPNCRCNITIIKITNNKKTEIKFITNEMTHDDLLKKIGFSFPSNHFKNMNDDDIQEVSKNISSIMGATKNDDVNDVMEQLVRNIIDAANNGANNNEPIDIFKISQIAANKLHDDIDETKFSKLSNLFCNSTQTIMHMHTMKNMNNFSYQFESDESDEFGKYDDLD